MSTCVYIGEGNSIPHTPESALSAGDVVDLGDLIGIAITDIAAAEQGALGVRGTWKVPKKTGETWAVGEPLYWDAGTTSFSNDVSYSEAVAGFADRAAASGDTHGYVNLTPGVVRS